MSTSIRRFRWEAIGQTIASHVQMLHEIGMIEEPPAATLLAAIDAVRQGDPPDVGLLRLVETFDDRVDGQIPAGTIGTARVGRGVIDVAATAGRMVLRDRILGLGAALASLREVLAETAGKHQTTMMPGNVGGFASHPTMLGHYLGGVISPLRRAFARLRALYSTVNGSPLGAGALATSGFPVDRNVVAETLCFDRAIGQSFDAVSAVDLFLETAGVVTAIETALSRYLNDLLSWTRREPEYFLRRGELTGTLSDQPQLRLPDELNALISRGTAIRANALALESQVSAVPYGPLVDDGDRLYELSVDLISSLTPLISAAADFFKKRFEPNRAFLANRAGKGLGTSSDIADLLMIEEQIDPGAARAIASLVTSRLMDEDLEINAITTEMIDAAALMTIGREIKVEFEAISRYTAPRRFIERRAGLGGPAPLAVRAYLSQEEDVIAADNSWVLDEIKRGVVAEGRLKLAFAEAAQQLDRG
jgi:argininosuccinate lyase